jgi:hypothetical protein
MSDNTTDTPAAPLISPEYAEFVRTTAADLERSHPEHAAALRQSLAAYQVPDAPVDPRTPAQQLHDRHHGVEPRQPSDYDINRFGVTVPEDADAGAVVASAREWAASLELNPVLGVALVHDILSPREPVDPEKVAALLPDGMSYTEAVRDVTTLLARAPMGGSFTVKAEELSPYALAQLAVWAGWLKRHSATRPR